jgi:polyisoprenoid-binding protein YceI
MNWLMEVVLSRKWRPSTAWHCILLLACGQAHVHAQTYAIDPAHTAVHWEVRHFGTSTLRGRLTDVQGYIALDAAKQEGTISISIGMHSNTTGVPALDTLLQSAQFFDTPAHPTAYFVAKQVAFRDGQPDRIQGTVTLRSAATELTLQATHFHCYRHPERAQDVCGGDFEATLQRSELDIAYGTPFVGNTVRLKIQIEATRDK